MGTLLTALSGLAKAGEAGTAKLMNIQLYKAELAREQKKLNIENKMTKLKIKALEMETSPEMAARATEVHKNDMALKTAQLQKEVQTTENLAAETEQKIQETKYQKNLHEKIIQGIATGAAASGGDPYDLSLYTGGFEQDAKGNYVFKGSTPKQKFDINTSIANRKKRLEIDNVFDTAARALENNPNLTPEERYDQMKKMPELNRLIDNPDTAKKYNDLAKERFGVKDKTDGEDIKDLDLWKQAEKETVTSMGGSSMVGIEQENKEAYFPAILKRYNELKSQFGEYTPEQKTLIKNNAEYWGVSEEEVIQAMKEKKLL